LLKFCKTLSGKAFEQKAISKKMVKNSMHKVRKLVQYLAIVLVAFIGGVAISLSAVEVKSVRNDETLFTDAVDAGFSSSDFEYLTRSFSGNIPSTLKSHIVVKLKVRYRAVYSYLGLLTRDENSLAGTARVRQTNLLRPNHFHNSFAFSFQLRGPPEYSV
jgi:hypothetical protein